MSLRIKGVIFLWISMLVFAAANSVIAKLGNIGAHNLIDGRNPISFCNVLFTGNLIAGITLLTVNWKIWNQTTVKKVRMSEWLMMAAGFFLGSLRSHTFFLGIDAN